MLTASVVKGRPGKSVSGRIRSSHPYLAAGNAAVEEQFPYMLYMAPLAMQCLTDPHKWMAVTHSEMHICRR